MTPAGAPGLARLLDLALDLGKGVVLAQRVPAAEEGSSPGRGGRAGRGLLHPQRLPELRPGVRGPGPAAVLLQLPPRLVPPLLRHRGSSCPASPRTRAARRSGGTSGGKARRSPARTAAAAACARRRCPSCSAGRPSPTWPGCPWRRRSAGSAPWPWRAGRRRSPATWSPRCARGCPSCRRWACPTSPWTAPRPPSPAARRSASAWPPSWAPTCAASATSSTSRPSGCTPATT